MLRRAEKVSPKAELGCSFDAKIIQLLHITVCTAKGRDKRSFCYDHGVVGTPPHKAVSKAMVQIAVKWRASWR